MSENKALWERYFPQFVNIDDDPALERLMAAARLTKIPKGKQVFYSGSVCENYLLMLEGCVKTQIIAENGRELLLYYVRSGDSCVLTTSCLLGGDCYPAEGVTEQAVMAFVIPEQAFHEGINQSAFFRQFVFNNFAKRLANVISRMEELIFAPIDLRLGRVLLASKQRLVRKTHRELAAELGSAREVISRHLKRFEAYGWVELGRGTIEIMDASALRNLLISENNL